MAIEKKRKAGEATALQKGRKLQAKSASRGDEEEDERDEEIKSLKKKKKKKKKKRTPLGLLIGVGVGVLVVLIIVGSVSAYFFTRPASQPLAAPKQVAQNPDKKDDKAPPVPLPPPPQGGVPIVPGIKEGNPAKKGGAGIVNNVRGAGYRTERRNELRQIGLFFQQFCEGTPKSGRTKEAFLDYIKRDSKAIHEAVSDGYYVMNMRADLGTAQSVIAYERDLDQPGHLCVRGDASVDYVPQAMLKELLK